MPKKSEIPLEACAVRLFEGDKDVLQRFYPRPGYNAVIRALVHRHCRKLLEDESRLGVNQDVRPTDEPIFFTLDDDGTGLDQ